MKKLFCSSSGFSLAEVVVSTGLLTIAGLSIGGLYQLSNRDSVQLRATRVAITARSQIEAAMNNPAAWRQTLAQNNSFACADTNPGCSLNALNGGYYDFVLYGSEPNRKLSFDPTDLSTRQSIRGGPCAAGVNDPDPRCPFKFQAQWKPVCISYPCLNPMVDVRVNLTADFGDKDPSLNPQNYGYSTVRGIDDGSLQSACRILNGTYNAITGTCYPKNAGKSCAALGKPAQIITGVNANGDITCSPLYSGQCDPATQVMTGISATGITQCSPKVTPPNCPVNCQGQWGNCSATCGGGTQTYVVTTPAANGGAACTSPAIGDTRACNQGPCPVNCVGSWSNCSQSCGGGTMTYSISTPAANGGASCIANSGDTQVCNSQACAVPVDCAGSWSACNPVTGTKTFTVTQAAQDGGLACPNPLTQNCAVDCVGSWGNCAGGTPGYKTYTWTTPPLNGGLSITCAYANGTTDSSACGATGCGPINWNAGAVGYDSVNGNCGANPLSVVIDNDAIGVSVVIANTISGFSGSVTARCQDSDPLTGTVAPEWWIESATCSAASPPLVWTEIGTAAWASVFINDCDVAGGQVESYGCTTAGVKCKRYCSPTNPCHIYECR